MVPSYLSVAVSLCGSVGKIKPFEDGVFPESLFYFQYGFLPAALPCESVGLLFPACDFVVVVKQAELHRFPAGVKTLLTDQAVGRQSDASDKKTRVDDPVEQFAYAAGKDVGG